MNLNREQFLKAVEQGRALLKEMRRDFPELKLQAVFSRFGPRSGQCDLTTDLRKIVMDFSEMLAEGEIGHKKHENPQRWSAGASVTARAGRVLSLFGESAQSERQEESFSREKSQRAQKGEVRQLRNLLFEIKSAEKGGDKGRAAKLGKDADEQENRLLAPELKLYCGDVLIEFRPGVLKYESLRRLQQNPRLQQNLNEIGTVRVVAGSLEFLTQYNGAI